ncbi:hypothetical protein GCM10010518_53100 [Kitasatospora cinereorecta]
MAGTEAWAPARPGPWTDKALPITPHPIRVAAGVGADAGTWRPLVGSHPPQVPSPATDFGRHSGDVPG